MYPPNPDAAGTNVASWEFEPLDPMLNAREETAQWARDHIPGRK
jgi:geranylgeranyl transferase type-1 subunit beta